MTKDSITEIVARALYETDPYCESGEYVDGFQVSPGGYLPWDRAVMRDAEFEGDPLMLQVTAWAFGEANAVLTALTAAGYVVVKRDGLERIGAIAREHKKLKYMGNCKCGECQLVPLRVLAELDSALSEEDGE